MLSFGTDDFFAFWTASYSVGLPAGSPPPVRAATSMFLMSFANILPRFASMAAFLCFVVAHLEWPLMAPALLVSRVAVRAGRPRGAGRMPATPRVATMPGACGSGRRAPASTGHATGARRCRGEHDALGSGLLTETQEGTHDHDPRSPRAFVPLGG